MTAPRPLLCTLAALALGASTPACPPPTQPPAPDASADAGAPPDAASPDAAPEPPPVPLPPVSAGELTLRAQSHGGFELALGARVVLRAGGGPVAARTYTESVRSLFGQWTFARGNAREWRPRAGASARAEADGTLVLALPAGADGASAELRFVRSTPGEVTVRVSATAPEAFRAAVLRFACEPDAHFLGFGEQYNALDHRGRSFPLFVSEQGIGRDPMRGSLSSGNHATTYFPVPFFIDPRRGTGLAVDTDARVEVDACAARPDEYVLAVEQPEAPLTLHLYTGPTVAGVMREWTVLQGRSASPPAWAVQGVWIGIQGGPDAVRGALARARAAGVPVGALWAQDWVGRREFFTGMFGVRYRWSVDPSWYPDLSGLISELHASGVRFLGYFNPFVLPDQDLWDTAVREGYLPRDPAGMPYTFPIITFPGSVVDLTNPRAVAWYREHARAAIALGMDGWMQDFGEWLPVDARLADGRDARRFHNLYPAAWHAAARAELEAARPDGNWVMFTRSGWLRAAHAAQVVWAGDQEADWSEHDGLPTVIPAMVSLGMAGIGFVTHDIAGFSGGPSTKELYQRWVELGAFTPVMRTHEGLMRTANWNWDRDAETLAHFARFARVHAALAPRLIELGRVHRETGMPIVRALPLVFPDDARTYTVLDEYLLGEELLVAPVVTQGATARRVYFPRGRWHDVWDPSRVYEGPMEAMVDAPIGRPPVFSSTPRSDLAAIR